MTRLCLDTSAYSNFRRGEPRVVAHSNTAQLDEFLAHPAVEVLATDENVARIYGEVFAELRGQGRPVPTNDLWIAATAVHVGATLLTFDAHFRAIARVGAVVL